MKNIEFFSLKITIFTAMKRGSILHRSVILMSKTKHVCQSKFYFRSVKTFMQFAWGSPALILDQLRHLSSLLGDLLPM